MTRDPTPKSGTTTSYVMASGKRKQPPQAPRYLFFEGNVAKNAADASALAGPCSSQSEARFLAKTGKSARLGNADLT